MCFTETKCSSFDELNPIEKCYEFRLFILVDLSPSKYRPNNFYVYKVIKMMLVCNYDGLKLITNEPWQMSRIPSRITTLCKSVKNIINALS